MSFFRAHPDLLPRFRQGDRETLSAVYWHYIDIVDSVIRRGFFTSATGQQIPGTHASEVADLVQDVFLRVFSEPGRQGYDGIREFRPYVVTIARNVLIDWGRKLRPLAPLNEVDEESLSARDDLPPELEWADPATVQIVETYIAGLPPDLAQIHNSRYVANLSQYEAARTLGLSRQQVRTLEKRLQSGLEKALEQQKRRHGIQNSPTRNARATYGMKEEGS